MQYRKEQLVTGECYHVFSRSIAKFTIFNSDDDYIRFRDMLYLYHFNNFQRSYSKFATLVPITQKAILNDLEKNNNCFVDIIAYSLMPTHIHLLIRQLSENGISNYMAKLLNSYSRFFNTTHGRTGPLWEGRFKNVHVKTDEQLMHLTRYLHLNATSAGLVSKPEDWVFSSYLEFIGRTEKNICIKSIAPDFTPQAYKKFVEDQKDYQRNLQIIKTKIIDS